MYKIISTKLFEKKLSKLDKNVSKKIILGLFRLEKSVSNVEELQYTPKDLNGLCKYKIGDYRVLLWVDEIRKEVILYSVAHGKDIYRFI